MTVKWHQWLPEAFHTSGAPTATSKLEASADCVVDLFRHIPVRLDPQIDVLLYEELPVTIPHCDTNWLLQGCTRQIGHFI